MIESSVSYPHWPDTRRPLISCRALAPEHLFHGQPCHAVSTEYEQACRARGTWGCLALMLSVLGLVEVGRGGDLVYYGVRHGPGRAGEAA